MRADRSQDARPAGDRPTIGPIIGVLAAMAVIAGVTIWRYPPPAPRPVDAPADVFSAMRAARWLEGLAGDGVPHPVGSDANAVVCGRIVAWLESWGYEPILQEATVERWRGQRIPVRNIMARLEGRERGPALMLAAHYDSVPEGPGAGDDGAGVAALLEIARMLSGEPPPRNDIVLLITDGEEAGLLGARAFFEPPGAHPWAGDVELVINLEARGTSGPSLMFETGDDAAWLVDLFARAVPRPVTSSLFYEVYRRLPNDTDFTIFRAHGLTGWNFAFIGSAQNYHTPRDDLDHLDLASLQHHGDNALGLVRALGEVDLERRDASAADLVYFDIFGAWLMRWPHAVGAAAAVIALVLIIASTNVLRVRGLLSIGRTITATGALVFIMASVTVAGMLLHTAISALGGIPAPWPARPLPVLLSIWSLGVAVAALAASARRLRPWEWWSATWIGWAVAATVLALTAAGASYLALVPTVLAASTGICAALVARRPSGSSLAAAAVVSATGVVALWFPLERLLYDALGLESGAVLAVRPAIIGTALLPALAAASVPARRGVAIAALVASIASGAAAVFVAAP